MIKPKEISISCVGYEIKADWYEGTNNQVWLVLPGYTSSKARYRELISSSTVSTGASALVIDYSGHGESSFDIKDMTRAQNFSEVIKAYDWLLINKPGLKISVHGTSYGGFHAAYLTKFRQFENIIFRVPASYPEETLYTVLGDMDDAHSEEYRKNPKNYINHWLFDHVNNVTGRKLVITHEHDDVCPKVATIPFVNGFDADHWEAKGFKHGFGESGVSDEQKQEYYKYIAEWIEK